MIRRLHTGFCPLLSALMLLFTLTLAVHGTLTVRAAALRPIWSTLLLSPIDGPAAPVARGRVHGADTTVIVPAPPPGGILLLTSDPTRPLPLEADDELRCLFVRGSDVFTFIHDFGSPDGLTTIPFGPVDITAALPPGTYAVHCDLLDLRPPLYATGPLYLVLFAPAPTPLPVPPSPTPAPAPTALPPTAMPSPTAAPVSVVPTPAPPPAPSPSPTAAPVPVPVVPTPVPMPSPPPATAMVAPTVTAMPTVAATVTMAPTMTRTATANPTTTSTPVPTVAPPPTVPPVATPVPATPASPVDRPPLPAPTDSGATLVLGIMAAISALVVLVLATLVGQRLLLRSVAH